MKKYVMYAKVHVIYIAIINVFFGTANRKLSDKDGLIVYLCYEHHEGNMGVHNKNGHKLDLELKKLAQKRWMEYYDKTEDDFRQRYGRSYPTS